MFFLCFCVRSWMLTNLKQNKNKFHWNIYILHPELTLAFSGSLKIEVSSPCCYLKCLTNTLRMPSSLVTSRQINWTIYSTLHTPPWLSKYELKSLKRKLLNEERAWETCCVRAAPTCVLALLRRSGYESKAPIATANNRCTIMSE